MSDAFQIELPLALAVKVEHAMSERKCSIEEAIIFLVDEVSTPYEHRESFKHVRSADAAEHGASAGRR